MDTTQTLLNQQYPGYIVDERVEPPADSEIRSSSVHTLTQGGQDTNCVVWRFSPNGGSYPATLVTPGTGFSFTLAAMQGEGYTLLHRQPRPNQWPTTEIISFGAGRLGRLGRTATVQAGDVFAFVNTGTQELAAFDTGNMPFEESYEQSINRHHPAARLLDAIVTFASQSDEELAVTTPRGSFDPYSGPVPAYNDYTWQQ